MTMHPRRLLALLVGFGLAAPLVVGQDTDAGAAPRIEIVTPTPLYFGAEFTAKERGLQPGERITWTVRKADGSPLPKEFLTRPLPGQNRCIVAGPPGDYVVTAEAFVVTLTEDVKAGDLKKGSRLPATVDRVLAQLPFTLVGDGGPRPPPPEPPEPPPPGPLRPLAQAVKDAASRDGWTPANLTTLADAFRDAVPMVVPNKTAAAIQGDVRRVLATAIPAGIPDTLYGVLSGRLKSIDAILPATAPTKIPTEAEREAVRVVLRDLRTACEEAAR